MRDGKRRMEMQINGSGSYLRFPVQADADPISVVLYREKKAIRDLEIRLARSRVDFWGEIFLKKEAGDSITIRTKERKRGFWRAIHFSEKKVECRWELPAFHFARSSGYLGSVAGISEGKELALSYLCNPFGLDGGNELEETVCGSSLLCLDNAKKCPENAFPISPLPYEGKELSGDLSEISLFQWKGKGILLARSSTFPYGERKYNHVFSIPFWFCRSGSVPWLKPFSDLEHLRVWKREWKLEGEFKKKLSFRTAPGNWPNIRILEAEGGPDDITAKAFEIQITVRDTEADLIDVDAADINFTWNRKNGMLISGDYSCYAGMQNELSVTVYSDYGCGEILCNGHVIFRIKNRNSQHGLLQPVDNGVSGNLEKCGLLTPEVPSLSLSSRDGKKVAADVTVYGMRNSNFTQEILQKYGRCDADETIFYQSEHFTVFYNHVEDDFYGPPHAWVVTSELVCSPVRVTEEFTWRETPWGDMVRAANRTEIWRKNAESVDYPALASGIPVLDASYNIAIDTLIQCKQKEYALEGQKGMWSAGLFQGKGEGFGVWMRDSAHIAIRGGNLLDPQGAGNTLRYAVDKGFDNGSDGCAMAACGIWDYYLATGQNDILFEVWEKLVQNMKEADHNFSEERHLVRAWQSTSNDSLEEPENEGYCLSTECYFLMAFRAMERIGTIVGEEKANISHWKNRADTMERAIQSEYWNPEYGYFTSGPKGSEAYRRGYWETSGVEAAISSRSGIASMEQKHCVLAALEKAAMCEYGIILFPYKEKKNHFCGSVWTVWEAGFASAASECGKPGLLHRLIAQQVRNCIINKTFYEVVDVENGHAWRWPGQLWHAAGFLSMILFGIFGMEYTEEGLCFHPCIPEQYGGISLQGIRYREASLTIRSEGTGCSFRIFFDGEPCLGILPDVKGIHEVFLRSYW